MVIGPSGVQFGLYSYEWLTKSNDHEGESDLLIMTMIADRIGRHEVLWPINQNYDKILYKKLDIKYTFS